MHGRQVEHPHVGERQAAHVAAVVHEVAGPQLGGVATVEGDELVVRAELDDAAALEHGDAVGVADRRQAVGDDDRRAPGQRGIERRLHLRLVVVVEVARRLVEDHHGRILEQQAGDRQALLLAAGQAVAAVADDGVEAVGQRRRWCRGSAPRRHAATQLVGGGVGLGVAQVVADRLVEQVRVLGDDADGGAQRVERQVADVVAVDAHALRR